MFCNEFQAICWKSLKLSPKQFILSGVARLCPILLYVCVSMYYSTIGNVQRVIPESYGYQQDELSLYSTLGTYHFYYAPTNPFTDKLMRDVQRDLQNPSYVLHGFSQLHDLEVNWQTQINREGNFLVIIFHGLMEEDGELPKQLNYTIRKKTYSQDRGNFYDTSIGTGSGLGIYEDFAALQLSINSNYLRLRGGLNRTISISMEEFPYPTYTKTAHSIELYLTFFPVFTMISFNFLSSSIITDVVEEKRTGVKELMKMMGLKPTLMWTAMYMKSLLGILVPLIGVVICVKMPFKEKGVAALPNSDFLLILIFLLLYYCACTSLTFTLSCLARKPFIAVIIATGVAVGTMGVALPLYHFELLSVFLKYLLALIPNGALVYGYLIINDFEQRKDTGLHWGNLFSASSAEVGRDYMGVVLLLLIFQSVFYMLLAFYLEAVFPGQFGIPKKWNFFIELLRDYFRSDCRKFQNSSAEVEALSHVDIPLAIEITNLRKMYNNNVVGLDNLYLRLEKGKINVLVGKNGAGKSTTLNILTGMTNYNVGTVSILGYDLKKDTKKVISMIGICPQDDLYYTNLSVANHFRFIAKLKGVENIETKVQELLQKLDLTKHKDKLPGDLSGGMKRKLCFGMSLMSNPKILILDEPTSGLDPISRRKLWDILQEWRKEDSSRTVVLSTHILEEAEMLGEYIAVIHSGKVLTAGTLANIINQYGAGYTLAVDRNETSSEKIIDIVEDCVDGAIKDKHSTDKTLLFIIPYSQQSKFAVLLRQFEEANAYATIKRTTLDDLFMTMTKRTMSDSSDVTDGLIPGSKKFSPPIVKILFEYQMKVFDWYNFFFLLLLTSLFLGIGLYLGNPTRIDVNDGELSVLLDLSSYGKTTVYYSGEPTSPFMKKLMNKYKEYVVEKGGIPVHVVSVPEALMDVGKKNILDYTKHSIVGAQFSESPTRGVELNVLYSEKATHAPPIALNTAYNVLFRLLNDTNESDSIVTISKPLKSLNYNVNLGEMIGFIIALFIIGAVLLSGTYIAEIPFHNKVDGMKHLQKMAGVSYVSYWWSLFLFHFMIWIINILAFVLVYFIFNLTFYSTISSTFSNPILYIKDLPIFVLYFLIFGYMNIIFIFTISSLYKRFSTIIKAVFIMNIFALIFGSSFKLMLILYEKEVLANILDVILNIFPCYWMFFNMKNFFFKLTENYQWETMDPLTRNHTCAKNYNPCCPIENYDENACSAYKSIYPTPTAYLFSFFVIIWLSESIFHCINHWRINYRHRHQKNDDHDKTKLLRVKDLRKVYKSTLALSNVSFEIKKGECTGILGPNGAGKSTTMMLLTGQQFLKEGEVYSQKFSIRNNISEYLQNIGYCAQKNIFNGRLTGRQMLKHMAELRNIPENDVESQVDICLKLIGLDEEMANRRCSKYSGGNKRKLCYGMAIIGLPTTIVLDEPSSGVDPVSRQLLWQTTRSIKMKGIGALLSSHIMEECEALCDRLILMKPLYKKNESVQNIVATGSVPEVKAKLGKGVIVGIVLTSNCIEVSQIEKRFYEVFKRAELKEKLVCHLTFYISSLMDEYPLSTVYSHMENLKREFPNSVDSYVVHPPSLEDIIVDIQQ